MWCMILFFLCKMENLVQKGQPVPSKNNRNCYEWDFEMIFLTPCFFLLLRIWLFLCSILQINPQVRVGMDYQSKRLAPLIFSGSMLLSAKHRTHLFDHLFLLKWINRYEIQYNCQTLWSLHIYPYCCIIIDGAYQRLRYHIYDWLFLLLCLYHKVSLHCVYKRQ